MSSPTSGSHRFAKAARSFCRDGGGGDGGSSAFGPGSPLVNGFLRTAFPIPVGDGSWPPLPRWQQPPLVFCCDRFAVVSLQAPRSAGQGPNARKRSYARRRRAPRLILAVTWRQGEGAGRRRQGVKGQRGPSCGHPCDSLRPHAWLPAPIAG